MFVIIVLITYYSIPLFFDVEMFSDSERAYVHFSALLYVTIFAHDRHVSDELNKMRMKEKYLNNQHNAMTLSYIEVQEVFTLTIQCVVIVLAEIICKNYQQLYFYYFLCITLGQAQAGGPGSQEPRWPRDSL